jgi:hypothetical protein
MCRAIGMFRTSYSFVAMSRPNVPDQLALMWYGNYNPAASQYTPLYLASEYLPEAYTRYVRYWGYVMVLWERFCSVHGPCVRCSCFASCICGCICLPVPGGNTKVARRAPFCMICIKNGCCAFARCTVHIT